MSRRERRGSCCCVRTQLAGAHRRQQGAVHKQHTRRAMHAQQYTMQPAGASSSVPGPPPCPRTASPRCQTPRGCAPAPGADGGAAERTERRAGSRRRPVKPAQAAAVPLAAAAGWGSGRRHAGCARARCAHGCSACMHASHHASTPAVRPRAVCCAGVLRVPHRRQVLLDVLLLDQLLDAPLRLGVKRVGRQQLVLARERGGALRLRALGRAQLLLRAARARGACACVLRACATC